MEKKTLKALEQLFKGTDLQDFDLEGDTAQELTENIERQIDETEVVYHSVAMEYLTENDASLSQSLELANACGYRAKDLSSEILATLLQQNKLRQVLSELEDEIEEIYEKSEE